jgi:signal transduction histidine kinase
MNGHTVEPPHLPLESLTPEFIRALPLGDLLSLGTQMRSDVTAETLLQEVADAIQGLLGYPQVYIRLRNADTDELETCAFAGVPDELAEHLRANPTAPAFYQSLLQSHYLLSESYLIPADRDVERDIHNDTKDHKASPYGVLLVPLRGVGGRLIGVIYVTPPNDPLAIELPRIQILESIARQAALGLENARLATRTSRLLQKEQLIADLGRDVSNTLNLDVILRHTIERIKHIFPDGSIILLNDQNDLEVVVSSSEDYDKVEKAHDLQLCYAICKWVIINGMSYLSNDLQNEKRIRNKLPLVRQTKHTIQAYISVPLRSGGRIIGTLNVESNEPHSFTFEDVDLLEAVAAQIGGPITSARLYQEAQRLADQVKRRNEQLTVLNTLARTAVSTLDVERMLKNVTSAIQQGFGYHHVESFIIDEERQEVVLIATATDAQYQGKLKRQITSVGYRQSIFVGIIGQAYTTASTVCVHDTSYDPHYFGPFDAITRSELCVPIISNNRIHGILNLESDQIHSFNDEDVSVLETVADMLASAMENARLYQRAQEAAVLEERSRLARDLHDSISQQLFSMTLTAQAARTQITKNPDRAAMQLERLQETATAALAEMRALIFQLRPPALSEQGLVTALHQHVSALGRREGLTAELQVNGEERYARGAEQALYRIVQESLNNILKHAGQCAVRIELDLQPEQIRLEVVDDGRGFNVDDEIFMGNRHLGLTSMRERAVELGGTLEVTSTAGKGTKIVVTVPGRDS